MSKLAADLASEDAERSLLENEADLPRTRSKKVNLQIKASFLFVNI